MTGGPFEKLRVIEHGTSPSIAYAGKLFADMGAEVIKVEPIGGDPLRHHGPFHANDPDPNESGWFLYLNANKRSITLNTNTASGQEILKKLLERTNILFQSNFEGALEDTSLIPDQLVREHPSLIIASVTPFGWNSPYHNAAAEDITLQALGGISIGIGEPKRPPLKLPGDQTSYQAGVTAAIAAATGLFSGRGHWFDIAAVDVWASFYSGVDVANAHFGRVKKGRAGHRVIRMPYPRTIFPCKDGFFAIQCTSRQHWHSFLKMVDREDLAEDPLFADRVRANDEHGDEADALFEPWFRERTKDEILQQCLRNKIPGAPVYTVEEVVTHPHLQDRNYFAQVNSRNGVFRLPTHPYKLPHINETTVEPAPRLGEYNQQLLRELEIPSSEAARLRQMGVM